MEINFSEIDEQNPYLNEKANPYLNETNQPNLNETNTNYWEQPKVEKPKIKKVSFDDILTNMNLVVSKDGTLRSMIPKTNVFNFNSDYNEQQQQPQNQYQQHQQQQYRQPQQQYRQQPQNQYRQQQEPIDPSVKHSFIYNKYFKDYKDATTPPEVKVPKTMEEYKKMLLEDKIERIKQQKRISEIKSTKLFFTTNTGGNGPINSSRNNLKSMSFR
jgi:DNA segregation ATPase FtsK/SpoIIIE-like protein